MSWVSVLIISVCFVRLDSKGRSLQIVLMSYS
jgi:hypothetical protein